MEENVAKLLKQAAVRSLSCEVVPEKEGEMYFGDERRGHVVSHTFFLQDSRARGFQRWFSIVVFMRDKHFLIKSWQFIHAQLNQLVTQLQTRASNVCSSEQKICSQRAARIAESCTANVARPVTVLTGSPDLYVQIHLWFTWMLSACSKRLEDFNPIQLPSDGNFKISTENGFVVVEKSFPTGGGKVWPTLHDGGSICSLREFGRLVGVAKFTSIVFAIVTGRHLVVRGPQRLVEFLLHLFKIFLPVYKEDSVRFSDEYSPSFPVIGVGIDTAVPVASASIYRLDIVPRNESGSNPETLELSNYQFLCRSVDDQTIKLPSFVTLAVNYVNDEILPPQIACSMIKDLVEKWSHIAEILDEVKKRGNQDLSPLLLSLGAQEFDIPLLKFWSHNKKNI